jgi:hypothetical protein
VLVVAPILVLARQVQNPLGQASDEVRSGLKFCFWFLIVARAVCPLGYLWPVINGSDTGAVVCQTLYTAADQAILFQATLTRESCLSDLSMRRELAPAHG